MRDIEFRGKRKDNGKWAFGYYVAAGGEKHYIVTGKIEPYREPPHITFEKYEVIPETVGLYSDFEDRNGVKIYEGDIVGDRYGNNAKVCFDFGCFFIMRYYTTNYLKNIADNYEVIGNIHDTSELLKEAQ